MDVPEGERPAEDSQARGTSNEAGEQTEGRRRWQCGAVVCHTTSVLVGDVVYDARSVLPGTQQKTVNATRCGYVMA